MLKCCLPRGYSSVVERCPDKTEVESPILSTRTKMFKNKLQQHIYQHLVERNWDKQHPADLSKSIIIEAAELLEHWQWNNKNAEEIKKDKQLFEAIQDELGDVIIYCIELAISLNVEFDVVAKQKLEKAKKKYPVDLVKKLKGDVSSIKLEYRKNKKK